MRVSLYVAVALAVILPLIFRSRTWVRGVCVFTLLLLAAVHLGYLLTVDRLIDIQGVQLLDLPAGQAPPKPFSEATRIVKRLHQDQIPLAAVIFAGLAILASAPWVERSDRIDDPREER